MVDERIIEHTDGSGNVLDRTVERTKSASGGGMGLIFGILLVGIFAVAAFFFLTNNSETKKDDAVAAAASDIGDAAKKVGNSAERAVDRLR